MTKFEYIMNRIASQHGVHSLFSDLLDLLIYTFSGGRKEKEYLKLINKYEKPEAYTINEAMAALLVEMTGDGDGMVDVLGKFYEENVISNRNLQFFTPQNTCDRMARNQNPIQYLEQIVDSACGSGRMLMAIAKVNRFAKFYGTENYEVCAKMAVINLCLNNMYGEIVWRSNLSNKIYTVWQVYPTIKGYTCIRQIHKSQSFVHSKLPALEMKSISQVINSSIVEDVVGTGAEAAVAKGVCVRGACAKASVIT